MLQSELSQYNRSHGVAYLLWFLFGMFGVHKFYIGKTAMAYIYLTLGSTSVIGFAAAFYNPGHITWWMLPGGALGLLLYDLFSIPSQISSVRDQKKHKIISGIKAQ